MRQIRRNVFETNSSSSHSVTIKHAEGLAPNHMPIHEDGYIHVSLGQFGWGIDHFNDQSTLLSYLVTMAMCKSDINEWAYDSAEKLAADVMKTKEFERISDAVAAYACCNGVIIDGDIEGYIDHQSHCDYSSVQDFLNDYDTDIIEFIYGNGTILHIDNDNH